MTSRFVIPTEDDERIWREHTAMAITGLRPFEIPNLVSFRTLMNLMHQMKDKNRNIYFTTNIVAELTKYYSGLPDKDIRYDLLEYFGIKKPKK